MSKKNLVLFSVVLFIFGCTTFPFMKDKPPQYIKDTVQTESFAAKRSLQISNVEYKLSVDVSEPGESFRGDQEISFDIKTPEDVYIDFQGGELLSAQVNHNVVKLERGPLYIVVPKSSLVPGRNAVQLVYRHEYSRSGSGLHKFKDPEDDKVYMYTDFEPYDASRFAPFFDQPDIKGTLELTVKAPLRWQVVSNTMETKFEKSGAESLWVFSKTVPMSTYLFAMMAGPYHVWKSQYKEIPLRIFVRDSLKKYVPYQEWFKITQAGLEYFSDYFAEPYPFLKYDQIIVPEFNAGAMENIAAVTFAEKYLKRKDYTRFDKRRLYNTVLHEMAHMWFGDLVTNKWWNDLWLNESFATYMATLAMVNSTSFKDSWVNFSIYKQYSYKQDESITTHPISGIVENSSQAFTNFDSITYGKGASVMKELSHYLGADLFRDSLRNYIKKHSYKNTTLNDFIAAFNETSKLNLTAWFRTWLKSTGVDRVKQSFSCEPNKITFNVEVSPGGKPRTIKVSGFKKRWGAIQEVATTLIQTQGLADSEIISREVTSEKKIDCPDFIYANHEDHGYLKIEFDEPSLTFIEENIDLINSDLLRAAIWSDLWAMVRDQKYNLDKFSELALKSLKTERNQDLLLLLTQKTVGSNGGEYDSVYYYMPNKTWSEKLKYDKMNEAYEAVIRERMSKEVADRYKIFLDAYLASVNSKEGLEHVALLLGKSDNPDVRWKLLQTLCREGYKKASELVDLELQSDKSEIAYKNSLSCRASQPNMQSKDYYVRELLKDKINFTSDEVDRITRSLYPNRQRIGLEKYRSEIFEALRTKWPKLEHSYQSDLAYGFAPLNCDVKSNELLSEFINSNEKLPPALKKPLLSKLDEDKRCLAVREFNRK
ncbi:MAG: aminopeptidase N [Bdellovibrionales bacterium]|nr:aminopeptidase N [Bdellovibrionales bacterium]